MWTRGVDPVQTLGVFTLPLIAKAERVFTPALIHYLAQGLREVVADAFHTLMVIDDKGAVLTRIWCLYEAWQTSRKGRGALVMLSYGIEFRPLEKVRRCVGGG